MGATKKSTLEKNSSRVWPLIAAFVALIWVLGPKQAQNEKIRALLV